MEKEVFTDELLEQVKNDPIIKDSTFCDNCKEHVYSAIIYIRQLENAQVVAKEALETINLANAKLTKDVEWLQDEVDRLRKILEEEEKQSVKKQMEALDNAHQRFVNRGKL